MAGKKKSCKKTEIIISMTTLPDRCENACKSIRSIYRGTMLPDRIILWLCHEDFGNEIPDCLVGLSSEIPIFEVRWSDVDYGPATKLLPAIKAFPDALIMNLDDDYEYKPDILENVYNCWKLNPNSIITVAAHRIGITRTRGYMFNRDGAFFGGTHYPVRSKGYDLMFLSGHGTMYPPHVFDGSEVMNVELMNSHWRTHDELWFWMNAVANGVETVVCGDYINLPGTGWTLNYNPAKDPLWKKNNMKEPVMLKLAGEFIKKRNPKVLKYFACYDPKITDLSWMKPEDRQLFRMRMHAVDRGRAENDEFVPDGFDYQPTLKKAPIYNRSFTEIFRDV